MTPPLPQPAATYRNLPHLASRAMQSTMRSFANPGSRSVPNLSLETYLKRICQICARQGDRPIPAAKLADAVRVPIATCTNVLLALKEAGLAAYQPYEGVMLTESGRVLALRALRRQRLVEQFLARTLNLGDDEVRCEAEQIEPAFSDALVERIDEFLGFPPTCPHGDPIPRA